MSDGAAAVSAAADHAYDAVLMDCQMPQLDGYQATAAIRAREGHDRRTPIIAMTAGARPEDRERCIDQGMDGYISKPVDKDELLALVARSLRPGPDVSGSSPTRSAPALEAAVDPGVLDLDLRILDGVADLVLFGDLVRQFTDDTESRLLELRQTVVEKDPVALRRVLHGIRASARQVGGRRLVASCIRLEEAASVDG